MLPGRSAVSSLHVSTLLHARCVLLLDKDALPLQVSPRVPLAIGLQAVLHRATQHNSLMSDDAKETD